MKYLIGERVINADQIVCAQYWPAYKNVKSQCNITITATEPITNYDGDPVGGSASIVIALSDWKADRFWAEYIGDSYAVYQAKEAEAKS